MIEKYPAENVVRIIKKTSAKMSARGLEIAADIAYSDQAKVLFEKALG